MPTAHKQKAVVVTMTIALSTIMADTSTIVAALDTGSDLTFVPSSLI